MSQYQLLSDIADVLVVAIFWISIAFCVAVSTFWKWWETDFGWTIVLKTAAIGLILLPGNLHFMFGLNPETLGWRWLGITCFALVGVIIVWRFVVLWTVQRYDPPPTKSGRAEFRLARRRKREEGQKEKSAQ